MPPRTPVVTPPVWAGPESPAPNGGITVSLLQKFLSCRQRFKVYAIDGWRAAPKFSHRMFYGSCWHAAEEAWAQYGGVDHALGAAFGYAQSEAQKFPVNREEIEKWYAVVAVTFPEYVRYWSRTPDPAPHTEVAQEQVFRVPYTLPSGRVVYLRGKRDGVTRDTDGRLWLFETKTTSEVDVTEINQRLNFDLQCGFYGVGLIHDREYRGHGYAGVRFNVARRPLSGGKGTIVRHKPTKAKPLGESESEYYDRLRAYIVEEPETYFFRWSCAVGEGDLAVFRREFLDPCLEFLCAWYKVQTDPWIAESVEFMVPTIALSWRTPFGLTGQIQDGYGSDLDHFMNTGSTIGLVRNTTLFQELT